MNRLTLPVALWLAAAFLSFLASVGCWFFVDKQTGLYIGLWVPSILSLGALLNSLQGQRAAEPAAAAMVHARQARQAN